MGNRKYLESRLLISIFDRGIIFQCCTKSDGLSTMQLLILEVLPAVGGKRISGVLIISVISSCKLVSMRDVAFTGLASRVVGVVGMAVSGER